MAADLTDKPERRTVQIPTELHLEMKVEAARRDVSMGELVGLGFVALTSGGARPGGDARARTSRRAGKASSRKRARSLSG